MSEVTPSTPHAPTVLAVRGVEKRYGPTRALRGVDLSLRAGEIHALLGSNGSGKSTLIRILTGVEPADAGTISFGGDEVGPGGLSAEGAKERGVHVVHQHRTTFQTMTVAENLFAGEDLPRYPTGTINWRAANKSAAEVLERFGIDARPRQLMGGLRPAVQRLVEIARALKSHEDARDGVLILDEPTEALAGGEVAALQESLRTYAGAGHAILYVSHRLKELTNFADRATILRDGSVVAEVGSAQIEPGKLADLISGREVSQASRRARNRGASPVRLHGERISGGVVDAVDLEIRTGEIVGLAGLEGSGRTTLLRLLFGLIPLAGGSISLDGEVLDGAPRAPHEGVALVSEDRITEGAFGGMSVRENLSAARVGRFWGGFSLRTRQEKRWAAETIAGYGIKCGGPEARFATLSGGNQQKAIIARWLELNPRLILLDEPTYGVDAGARAEIHRLIHKAAEADASAVIVSSDSDELVALCDRVLVLDEGHIEGELSGDALDATAIERRVHSGREVVR